MKKWKSVKNLYIIWRIIRISWEEEPTEYSIIHVSVSSWLSLWRTRRTCQCMRRARKSKRISYLFATELAGLLNIYIYIYKSEEDSCRQLFRSTRCVRRRTLLSSLSRTIASRTSRAVLLVSLPGCSGFSLLLHHETPQIWIKKMQ